MNQESQLIKKTQKTPCPLIKNVRTLQYGLEIIFQHARTREVDSVRCKFCISLGRESFVLLLY